MRHRNFYFVAVIVCALNVGTTVAQDNTGNPAPDTASFKWPPFIGGDIFVNGEVYGLHLGGPASLEPALGIGAELRIKPVFLGFVAGFSGDDGIPGLHGLASTEYLHYSPNFTYTSLYCGVTMEQYRYELGELTAKHFAQEAAQDVRTSYSCAFAGVSRRFGKLFLFEPCVKIVFPLSATYPIVSSTQSTVYPWITRHYHLSDLFFAIGLKVGIGFN